MTVPERVYVCSHEQRLLTFLSCLSVCLSWMMVLRRKSEMGQGQETIRLAAVIFSNLARVMFLLTLLLFSLGWGFIRSSLRAKEGWVVSSPFYVTTGNCC